MTIKEHYRSLLRDLEREYINAVAHNTHEQWNRFESVFREVCDWADLASAAKIRNKAYLGKIIVPEHGTPSLPQIEHANDWARDHRKLTAPMIRERARQLREIEQHFVDEHGEGQNPLNMTYRLEMAYRNIVADVGETAEQIQLATPDLLEELPYSEYRAEDDNRTRRTHKAMHGFLALRSWEGWSIVRPKNGYNCRCWLMHWSLNHAIKMGWARKDGTPRFEFRWPNSASKRNFFAGTFPDPGWHGPKVVA